MKKKKKKKRKRRRRRRRRKRRKKKASSSCVLVPNREMCFDSLTVEEFWVLLLGVVWEGRTGKEEREEVLIIP